MHRDSSFDGGGIDLSFGGGGFSTGRRSTSVLMHAPSADADDAMGHFRDAENRYSRSAVCLCWLFPALGGLLFGYDIGATSYVLPQLLKPHASGVDWSSSVKHSSFLQGLVASGGVLGAFLGAVVVFRVADALGRRREIVFGAILYVVGAALEGLAGGPPTFLVDLVASSRESAETTNAAAGLGLLLVGRVVYGVGCGFVMHGAPAYIAEMAPASIRGMLVSLKEAAIVVGICVGYGVGFSLSTTPRGWQITYAASIPLSFFLAFGMASLPASARWLAFRGDLDAAEKSLKYVYPTEAGVRLALDELADVLPAGGSSPTHHHHHIREQQSSPTHAAITSSSRVARDHAAMFDEEDEEEAFSSGFNYYSKGGGPGGTNKASSSANDNNNNNNNGGGASAESDAPSLFAAEYRPALVAGLGVVLLQQITGQPSVLYYATTIFDSAGIGSIATVFVGAFKLLATLGAVAFVDSRGRRFVLMTGICVMLVALVGLVGAFAFFSTDGGFSPLKALVVGLVFLYVLGYQLGFGPVAWLLISEIFPLQVRGQAVALAVQTNFAANLLVTFLFPVALDALRSSLGGKFALSSLFGLFAILDAYSLYFVFRYVPETKGLTLEQIQANLMKGTCDPTSPESGVRDHLDAPLMRDPFAGGASSP